MPATPSERAQSVLDSPHYVRGPEVELFVEHTLYDKDKRPVRKVGANELQEIAKDAMARFQASGNLAAFGPGHTYDDEYEVGPDGKPKLLRKFPETDQPPIWGYLDPRYRLAQRPGDGKWALYATPYVRRVIDYVEQGNPKQVYGADVFREFPHRSPEYWSAPQPRISYLALLRREPKLDMGIAAYARSFPDKALFLGTDGASLAGAISEYGGLVRYAIGVDQLMAFPTTTPARYAADDAGPPPPAPPKDEGVANKPPAPSEPAGPDSILPDEHKRAAEEYAKHCFGMHYSRAAHLLHHYAKATGMGGNMMDPMAPTNPPGQEAKALEHPVNAPGALEPVHRMSAQDQRIAALEKRLADQDQEIRIERTQRLQTESAARYERRQHLLTDMVEKEGFQLNVEEHMAYARDMPDGQFDQHVSLLRKSAAKAPISDGSPIDPWGAHKPYKEPEMTPERHDGILATMRRYSLSGPDAYQQAAERYDKDRAAGKI